MTHSEAGYLALLDLTLCKIQNPMSLFSPPASTVSSQILLTHLFLLDANHPPGIFAAFSFLTLFFLPFGFPLLRLFILPRCFPNLTHATDLRVKERAKLSDLIDFSVFIQALQLQSSKVSVLSIVWAFL